MRSSPAIVAAPDGGCGFSLTTKTGPVAGATFGGVRVPARGEAGWDLPEGRFVYWRGRVIGVELLDRPAAITARA
jgi:hypothetical protein